MIKVSGIAMGQWNSLCKDKVEDIKELRYKIIRAMHLGHVTYVYDDGTIIKRYYDLNLLYNSENGVMTIWRDRSRKPYMVSDYVKLKYDLAFKED